jgi:hypothetical protein
LVVEGSGSLARSPLRVAGSREVEYHKCMY